MRSVMFYNHFYFDKYGQPKCTGWVSQDFWDWLHSNDRDESDMGEDKKTILIQTNIRIFNECNNQWFEEIPF